MREPLGGGRAPSAGPNAAQRQGPQGWAGHTQDDWPQATNQTPCAKRLTDATVPQPPQGSQTAARRARMRPGSADGCATAPAKAILHKACCLHPKGAKRWLPQKELATDWRALRAMRRYVTLPQRACATTATNTASRPSRRRRLIQHDAPASRGHICATAHKITFAKHWRCTSQPLRIAKPSCAH